MRTWSIISGEQFKNLTPCALTQDRNGKMFKLKIYPKRIPAILSVILISMFAYSQMSWGNLVPSTIWIGILILSVSLMLWENIANSRIKLSIDLYTVIAIMILVICLVWNNQDIARYGWQVEKYFAIIIVFNLLSRGTDKWHKYAVYAMLAAGFFYTFWTFICYFDQNIYNGFVYPLMATQGFIPDYKAGFTVSYGTNGLYMAMGVCAYTGFFVFNGKFKIKDKKKLFGLLILIIGMLLSGKRGQTIALVIAFYVLYYFYNSNKKFGRVFKVFLIISLLCLIMYLVSLFIPGVLTIIDRFQEQSSKGDISTGRFYMWNNAWILFKWNPLFGYGWRWFRYSQYTLVNYDVHNVFLQWLTELGIVGSIPFFAFIIMNIVKAIRLMISYRTNTKIVKEKVLKYISVALMYEVFFIVMCATGTAFYQIEYLFPYLVCCGMVHYYIKGENIYENC